MFKIIKKILTKKNRYKVDLKNKIDEIETLTKGIQEIVKQNSESITSFKVEQLSLKSTLNNLNEQIKFFQNKKDLTELKELIIKQDKKISWCKDLLKNQGDELIYSDVWRDTIQGLKWISPNTKPSLSPGRWAVGYNYLYVMTRILNEVKPTTILEFGLGNSTLLISEYVKSNPEFQSHIVIEQNAEWKDFYIKNHSIEKVTSIIIKPCRVKEIEGHKFNSYGSLDELAGKKFDVISIDGPIGTPFYSRRDILDLIPDILNKDFIILIDDVNRSGEKKTIVDLQNKLTENSIAFKTGYYDGNTRIVAIASESWKWLCSL